MNTINCQTLQVEILWNCQVLETVCMALYGKQMKIPGMDETLSPIGPPETAG